MKITYTNMDHHTDVSQKIEELSNHIKLLLEKQNSQYTDVMLKLKELEEKISASNEVDNRSVDDLYDEARELVIEMSKASTSFLQRALKIGYARSAQLMDMLEEKGIIGPSDGAKPRKVLIKE